jgi:hypothetical protein
LLKAAIAGRAAPYSYDDLDVLAKHFTEEEDAANKVERQVGKSAAAMFLESRIGEQFSALVTGASDKGTWARLLTLPVEGRVVRGVEGVDVGDQMDSSISGESTQPDSDVSADRHRARRDATGWKPIHVRPR